jgi:two-component system, OmpR family, sensor histidine kinase KdpD
VRSLDPTRANPGTAPASTRLWPPRFRTPTWRDLTGYLWAAGGIFGVTFTLRSLVPNVNHTTVALSYLVVVLLAASARGLGPSILASVAGVICFNYYFLPPVGSFTIADPQNWVALTAFLITAFIASQLSSAARSRARDAERRREEVWKLYQLSRAVIIIPDAESAISSIAWQVLDVFGASFCSVLVPDPGASKCELLRTLQPSNLPTSQGWNQLATATAGDRSESAPYLSGDVLHRVLDSGEIEAMEPGSSGFPGRQLIYAPLKVGVRRVGVLVLVTSPLETGTIEAVAGLVAVALERARFLREASRTEALRQSDELKSALLASVSHALRTPLTSIRAAVDNLLQNDPSWSHNTPSRGTLGRSTLSRSTLSDDTLREFHLIISEEVGRLTRLVNNLLEMARIEAGELHLIKEWTLVSEVFGNVLERCSLLLTNHLPTAQLDQKLPLVKIDSRLIAEALVNIVENAAKYCPAGATIRLEARMNQDDLLITVADNGPGIAPEEIDRVFDKFYRSPSVTDTGISGTGMGLAIARGIIVAHGGRVWAESARGRGTLFTLAIPVEWKFAESAESADSAEFAESSESGKSAESADSAKSAESPESSENTRAESAGDLRAESAGNVRAGSQC